MAAQTNPPQSMSAHVKQKYMNWTPPIPVFEHAGTVTLHPNSLNRHNHAIRLNIPFITNEYLVVEYRSTNAGITDSTLPGSGLIVYRIRPSTNGNAQGPPDEVYAFRPSGGLTFEGDLLNAFLSLESGRVLINDTSNPRLFTSHDAPTGLSIYNIGSAGDSITFNVAREGLNPNIIDESFEDQTFTNFDWFNDPIAPWTITNETSQHGTYSAVSGQITHDETSRLEINLDIERSYLQFYIKTSTEEGSDFLRFLVNGVQWLFWSGETDWTYVAIPFEAGTYNFAWVYSKDASGSGGQDKVWIDQIGFPTIRGHIPYPPRNLTLAHNDRDITLNWDKPFKTNMENPPTLLGYSIIQDRMVLSTEIVSDTTYTITNSPGGVLPLRVIAVYDIGESVNSNTANVSIPIAPPSSLTANIEGNAVRLGWEYAFDSPSVRGFRVIRNGVIVSLVDASERMFIDDTVTVSGMLTYQVRALLLNPMGISDPSNSVEVDFVSTEDDVNPYYITELGINYPNPFNPATSIRFTIANVENVKIDVYNVRGQLVRTLVNDEFAVGQHSIVWDGKDMNNSVSPSGIYFYRLTTQDYQATKKMILLK
jgi:hypothetical protein